jgi:hypothetical protein
LITMNIYATRPDTSSPKNTPPSMAVK